MAIRTVYRRTRRWLAVAPGLMLSFYGAAPRHVLAQPGSGSSLRWDSPARLHRPFKSLAGTLSLAPAGVEFRSDKGETHRWPFIEIKTFDLSPRRFTLTTYQNQGWHRPGDRRYRFDLAHPVPPEVATRLAQLVGKPVVNGDPDPHEEYFAAIPARRRTLTGGSNGALQFSQEGIAYVAVRAKDGRSWRWSDIQTLAHPDPYHFTVGGYRETYSFELKRPMSEGLFDRLWDFLYGRGLQLGVKNGPSEDRVGATQSGTD